jgi:hypothetical protein
MISTSRRWGQRAAVVRFSYFPYHHSMRKLKERLTVTVDRALVDAANAAVKEGRAASLSGWVSRALEERAAKEHRLRALADAVAAYEMEFGVISAAEIAAQQRADSRGATVVRGPSKPRARRRHRGRAA